MTKIPLHDIFETALKMGAITKKDDILKLAQDKKKMQQVIDAVKQRIKQNPQKPR